jgi:transcription termination/antitermination protein NusG
VDSYWYAIYTRSRQEQAVSRFLERFEKVHPYVPLKEVWSKRVDRRRRIRLPAFPGYIFLRCVLTAELRAAIKKAPGVVSIVTTGGLPCRIPDEQIESVRILLDASKDVDVHAEFEIGQLVRIRSGPLKGARGTLIRTNPGRHRLMVRIEYVGLALSAEVHEADVEREDALAS